MDQSNSLLLPTWADAMAHFPPIGGLASRLNLLRQLFPLWKGSPCLPTIHKVDQINGQFHIEKTWPFAGTIWDGYTLPTTFAESKKFALALLIAAHRLVQTPFRFSPTAAIPLYFSPQQLYVSSNWDKVAFDGVIECFLFWNEAAPPPLLEWEAPWIPLNALNPESTPLALFSYSLGITLYRILSNDQRVTLSSLEKFEFPWPQIIANLLEARYITLEEFEKELTSLIPLLTPMTPLSSPIKKVPLPSPPHGMITISPENSTVAPFWIDQFPVTVAEFRRFNPSYQPSSYSSADDCPATMISWSAAIQYCRWRSEQEKLPEDAYHLPTKVQWKAAFFANQPYKTFHAEKSKLTGTVQVSVAGKGNLPLYGLVGNVWEWCQSPGASSSPMHYLIKGGAWWSPLSDCLDPDYQQSLPFHTQRPDLGFRCIRSI